jgi:hypothetical protein
VRKSKPVAKLRSSDDARVASVFLHIVCSFSISCYKYLRDGHGHSDSHPVLSTMHNVCLRKAGRFAARAATDK